ncbi:MAG: sigma-54-dependent Fis family transcriptional regulator, partial [Deltaproteobacteria bacterium]|nr:sigma-54-dependent Fis family transcriptional regulator [Deltaproteobacteria bacterium]
MTGVNAWETTSGPVIRPFDGGDPTPGLVLIYSRLHAGLPSAFPFAQNPTRIGRELDNEIAIPEGAVSRYHARVERVSSDGWLLRDLGSTNGTIVNGITITQPHLLRTHDVVRIGDTIMRFTPQNLYAFTAYRIDGTVVEGSRPVSHSITQPLLVGGLQVDQLLERIDKIGASELSVFISGESGTGKELIARELHRRSQRRGAFQAINCAALPGHLIESELFGYKRGSFTGAHADKVGLVKLADRGTLFLDEIGDMPFDAQAKLLRVLQEREVLPLGGTTV